MKKFFVPMLIFFGIAVISACDRDNVDSNTTKLTTMSIGDIRNAIRGSWRVQRSEFSFCGYAGCNNSAQSFPNNSGDIFHFLQNDTIRRVRADGSLLFNYKAEVYRFQNTILPPPPDSLWGFRMGPSLFTMIEIHRDTLVVDDGFLDRTGSRYFLTKR